MKKQILFLLFFMLSLFQIQQVNAWSNGNSGSAYANDLGSFNIEVNYGGHDWIADRALEILFSDNSTNWQWLHDRKNIMFLGTEAPDNSNVNDTFNGIIVSGFGDTTYHHIYFEENGDIMNNEDDAALRAKSTGDLANMYYGDSKLDLAAFYLGTMAHYLGDMAMYAHTAKNYVDPYNIDFDEHHSTIEGYVHTRTNEYDDVFEFFKVNISSISNRTPYNAAVETAWSTYQDAKWSHDNFFTGWKQSYDSRLTDTYANQLYYLEIEQNLNNAIQACVDSIVNRIPINSSSGDGSVILEIDPDDIPEDDLYGLFTIPAYPIIPLLSIICLTIVFLERKTQ